MRLRTWIVIGLLAVIALGAGRLAWRWNSRGPGRPSVGKAIERFRTSSTVAAVDGMLQPPPGVYTYRGSGRENLTFLHTQQGQGPTEPGTVTTLSNGCWLFRMDFNSFHSQTWRRCSSHDRLLETGGTADQKFDFVAFKQSEHSTTKCTPPFAVADPNAVPGVTGPVHCVIRAQTTGTNSIQDGTLTFVGRETVNVGGTTVPALHERQRMKVSGDQTGSVQVDIWFAVKDGLPLRERHNIVVVSPAPAPLDHVTYTERGSWLLTSLTPRH